MAPGYAWAFDEAHLRQISAPMCLVAGASDRVMYPKANAGYFAQHIPGATFTLLPEGVGHFTFLSCADPDGIRTFDPRGLQKIAYQDEAGVDRAAVHGRVINLALPFLRRALLLSR
jgi:predicted dienelactone hydrolase